MKKQLLALTALCAFSFEAQALSITPLVDEGVTFMDKKVVMVTVANAYRSPLDIVVEPFEPDLVTPAFGVKLRTTKLNLGPNGRRRMRVIFDVPEDDREIAICVRTEIANEEMVIPRVCGRYYARRIGTGPR